MRKHVSSGKKMEEQPKDEYVKDVKELEQLSLRMCQDMESLVNLFRRVSTDENHFLKLFLFKPSLRQELFTTSIFLEGMRHHSESMVEAMEDEEYPKNWLALSDEERRNFWEKFFLKKKSVTQ